jgi:EmrB/QacA subfamily drug resistance transporter
MSPGADDTARRRSDDASMTPEATADPHHARRWRVLALVGIAQLMVVLDASIVNIALPSAQKALDFSNSDRQWIVTAYALAFGSLLLVGGRIGDVVGRRTTFVAGLIGFAVVSAIGGAAQSFGMLVGARALQGAFGALLAPAALSLLSTTFSDPGERGKAFGIFGAIAGGGAAVGLLLGGVLTEYLSWRWCLYVNLVFAIPTAATALTVLQRQPRVLMPRIDVAGTVAATLGLFALVYGFNRAEVDGWESTMTLGFLAGAVVLLAAFAAIERRAPEPLLPPRVVLDRNRGGAFLAVGIVGIGMFGAFFFLTFFLQLTLGFSPIHTGLAFLPMVVAIVATASTTSTVLLPRRGPRPLMTLGMLLAAGGAALLAQLNDQSGYAADVLPALILVGMGLGLVMAPAMNTATLGVPAADAGVASASVNTMQQVGGSIGTALLSTLAASATSHFLAGKPHTAGLAAEATVHGYSVAFWCASGIFAVGAVVCGLLLRGGALAPNAGARPALAS